MRKIGSGVNYLWIGTKGRGGRGTYAFPKYCRWKSYYFNKNYKQLVGLALERKLHQFVISGVGILFYSSN